MKTTLAKFLYAAGISSLIYRDQQLSISANFFFSCCINHKTITNLIIRKKLIQKCFTSLTHSTKVSYKKFMSRITSSNHFPPNILEGSPNWVGNVWTTCFILQEFFLNVWGQKDFGKKYKQNFIGQLNLIVAKKIPKQT